MRVREELKNINSDLKIFWKHGKSMSLAYIGMTYIFTVLAYSGVWWAIPALALFFYLVLIPNSMALYYKGQIDAMREVRRIRAVTQTLFLPIWRRDKVE